MDAEEIDPRDQTGEIYDPTYRVQFWGGMNSPAKNDAESSWRLRGAADVLEVLEWAERQKDVLADDGERPFFADSFMVYVETASEIMGGVTLTRILGAAPL
jgi:hypothetical protein